MRPYLLAAALLLTGCGGLIHDATAKAVDTVTSPAAQKALDATAAGAAKSATEAARDVLASPVTQADIARLAKTLRSELVATRDALLDEKLQAEVDALREQLAGAPLRADVDALIDEATPRLAAAVTKALAPVKADADATVARYKQVAIGLAVAAVAMLLALGFCIWELRRHRAAIAKVLIGARRGR